MVTVKWTKNALEELDEIAKYISRDSPKFAKILVNQMFETARHLEQFAKLGRIVPEYDNPDLREIIYKNYRIIYLIKREQLEIISIIHGSRKLNL